MRRKYKLSVAEINNRYQAMIQKLRDQAKLMDKPSIAKALEELLERIEEKSDAQSRFS